MGTPSDPRPRKARTRVLPNGSYSTCDGCGWCGVARTEKIRWVLVFTYILVIVPLVLVVYPGEPPELARVVVPLSPERKIAYAILGPAVVYGPLWLLVHLRRCAGCGGKVRDAKKAEISAALTGPPR